MISVVVPVKDGMAHLETSLGSIMRQSYGDIEIIVVDNGSTDGSVELVEGLARQDPRVKLHHSAPSGGAGLARNTGLLRAVGDYVAFLDCDDEFDSNMLEELHFRAIAEGSDVVICAARAGEHGSDRVERFPSTLCTKRLAGKQGFAPIEFRDDLFTLTNPAPWNKLFRTSFVSEHGLRFQEIRRTNDLAFTYAAIANADRVGVVDVELMTYRRNNPGSLTAERANGEWHFLDALDALDDILRHAGLHERYRKSFVSLVVRQCLSHLFASHESSSDDALLGFIRSEVFPKYDIRPSLRFVHDLWESQGFGRTLLFGVMHSATPRSFPRQRRAVRKLIELARRLR